VILIKLLVIVPALFYRSSYNLYFKRPGCNFPGFLCYTIDMLLYEYYNLIAKWVEKNTGKSKKKELPKLQTRLSTTRKKTNKLQSVQKRVRK